ncbi:MULTISPECIES: hypothetical protein [Bacillus cereus group]|uniref:hypothetical protein n=1 Tax=Bacillus cereus group TaxID=86661 RepID=UPI0003FB942D|nr:MULTISPECIES: hypothetical protein [Bacillus cereus group]QUG99347.1 hypothetical protein HCM98_31545 [Bacillus tropicus]
MKIVLKGEHAQRFCEPLIEFMRKNPELFKSGEKQDEIKRIVKSRGVVFYEKRND